MGLKIQAIINSRFITRRLLIAPILALLPLVYFYPAVKGQLALAAGDAWLYSLPMRMLLGRMIAEGTLPLWNPHTFAGMPLLASAQPGVLYPPNWLFAALPPGVAINAVIIITYQLTLIGTYLYARALQMDRAAALLTGITFTFGGFMISHLEQVNFIAAAAWLPWILWVMEKLYRAESWREAWRLSTCGAIVIALHFFAGLPQATAHIAPVCGAYLIFSLFIRADRPKSFSERRRFAAAVVVMVVCGALLSAVQFLPARELQLQGERAAISYETFATFSLPPRRLLSFIAPYFFGGALPPIYSVAGWDHWWLHKYVHGYVGMLALLLAMMAVLAAKSNRLVWFWAGIAIVSLFLSFGSHLPFDLHQLLYQVPVYNLFRGPYRHTYGFTFAMAVLAGLGMNAIARDGPASRKAFLYSSTAIAVIVVATAVAYRFFAHRLGSLQPPPPGATSLSNSEIYVPLIFFTLSLGALWLYARRQTKLVAAAVIVVLQLDLAFFGWFTYWRSTGYELVERLNDPPAVKAIKERESDLRGFRVVTHAANPYHPNYENLSHGNMAIPHGLQSVTGYDPMRLSRLATLAGGPAGSMDIFGVIGAQTVFATHDQGLDLLNVKYLLRERKSLSDGQDGQALTVEGIRFAIDAPEVKLAPGAHPVLDAESAPATELAIISTMTDSTEIPDGAPVARVKLRAKDGGVIERELLAGRDTAEWAYDRADVRAAIKHRRAKVAESWDAEGFQAHRYLARLNFPRAEFERIELDYLKQGGAVVIKCASLFDSATGRSTPIGNASLPYERWRRVGSFGEVDLYENLRALPRAWLVPKAQIVSAEEALRRIHGEGEHFDPRKTALIEPNDKAQIAFPQNEFENKAEARIAGYEPNRLAIETVADKPATLVLSEISYPGWEATIDGQTTTIFTANYLLRGVVVPEGKHRVEMRYTAPAARRGAIISALTLLALSGGFIFCRRSGPHVVTNLFVT